ncbi:MAG: hemerythrin family protein, partial [Candidatus Omnitrophica bacterium]|nr:hemerythrin family protein [Candidatus Omnitrophota bacterium]
MELFKFSERYSVGVDEIDFQHKKLIGMVNDLFEASQKGESRTVIGDIINGMAEYAVYHFSYEEKHMTEFSFEGLEEHKIEHDNFVAKTLEFKKAFDKGKAVVSLDVLSFLFEWVKKHILDTDKKYTKCFRELYVLLVFCNQAPTGCDDPEHQPSLPTTTIWDQLQSSQK